MSEEYIYVFLISIIIFAWLNGSHVSEISMVLIFSTIIVLLSSPNLISNYHEKNTEQFDESAAVVSTQPIFSEDISEDSEYVTDPSLIVFNYDMFKDPISNETYYKQQSFCKKLLFYISPFNKQKTNNDTYIRKTYNALDNTPLSRLFASNYHDRIASNFSQKNGFKVHTQEIVLPQANMLFNYDNAVNAYEDFSMFFVFKFDKHQLDNTQMGNSGYISLVRLKALNSFMIDNVYLEIKLDYKDYNAIRNPNIMININLVNHKINITEFDTIIDDEYHSLLFSKDATRLIVMLDNKIIHESVYDNKQHIATGLGDNSIIAQPSTQDKSFVINSNPSQNNNKQIYLYLLGFGLYPRHAITNVSNNSEILKYHKSIHHNMDPTLVRLSNEIKDNENTHKCPFDDNTCYSTECNTVSDWVIPSSKMALDNEQCYKKIHNYCENQSITECMDYKKKNILDIIKIVDPLAASVLESLDKTENKEPVINLIKIIKDKKVPANIESDESTFLQMFDKFINKDSNKNSAPPKNTSLYPEINLDNLISNIETFVTEEEDTDNDYTFDITESLTNKQKQAIHRIIMKEYIDKQ